MPNDNPNNHVDGAVPVYLLSDADGIAIAQALNAVAAAGWKVNNIQELDNGLWRVSLRNKDTGYEFGQDHIIADAIAVALRHATAGNGDPLLASSGGVYNEVRRKPLRTTPTAPSQGNATPITISDDDL